MTLTSLEKLFHEELADIYNAETQLIKALPKMAKAAAAPELKEAFSSHLLETQRQAQRLEKIFAALGKKPPRKVCKAMKGLVEEGGEVLQSDGNPDVRDAALIAAAQRVEHYEIAAYGCARTYAELLGDEKAATLLQQSLNEESAADKKLTKLATDLINIEAAQV